MEMMEVKLSKAEVRDALAEAAKRKLGETIHNFKAEDYEFVTSDISPLAVYTLVMLQPKAAEPAP